ncbi:TapB family protein [Chitinophaga lutea]|nr:hypothetical protein [Chitinophaga lutea]
MKRLWITATFFLTALAVAAQDCRSYYYMVSNSEVEMTVFNGEGASIGKQHFKIADVKKEGGDLVSSFTSVFSGKDGKTITSGQGTFKCNGNGIFVDMKMNMPSMPGGKGAGSAKTSAAYLSYPGTLSVGQKLSDGNFSMDTEANGMKMKMDYAVKDRKVTGKEKVTTPAGTWDCYKITYAASFKMNMMGKDMEMPFNAAEWFAPGFGVVKTVNYGKEGNKVMGSTEITKVVK